MSKKSICSLSCVNRVCRAKINFCKMLDLQDSGNVTIFDGKGNISSYEHEICVSAMGGNTPNSSLCRDDSYPSSELIKCVHHFSIITCSKCNKRWVRCIKKVAGSVQSLSSGVAKTVQVTKNKVIGGNVNIVSLEKDLISSKYFSARSKHLVTCALNIWVLHCWDCTAHFEMFFILSNS